MYVRPKKFLGQHFLKDEGIALQIVESITGTISSVRVLEVGPGTGVLSAKLLQRYGKNFSVCEIDRESVAYLRMHYPGLRILEKDFLQIEPELWMGQAEAGAIVGNFPYNISSQIVFRVIEHRQRYRFLCGMFQKEVAERICAPFGSKTYGIISVLAQVYFNCSYLFTVEPHVFHPPPKVRSGVILMERRTDGELRCNEVLFKRIVKTAFNQRRKTLRNALLSMIPSGRAADIPFAGKRAEQLSVQDFIALCLWFEQNGVAALLK